VNNVYEAGIWLYENGTLKPLAAAVPISSATAALEFELSGSTLKLYVNNHLEITVTDMTLGNGGVGVRGGNGTSFSNVSVS
jgi:hypothetical protein